MKSEGGECWVPGRSKEKFSDPSTYREYDGELPCSSVCRHRHIHILCSVDLHRCGWIQNGDGDGGMGLKMKTDCSRR